MNNIILIGMPGVGKSCIGVVLAKALNMSFIDSDIVIQERMGRNLRDIIAETGRDGFLRLENEINAGITADNSVIATGGSAVFGEEAMEHFRRIGKIVYLAISCADLEERLGDLDERGVIHEKDQTLADIYAQRVPLYERYADVTVWEDGVWIRFEDMIGEISARLGKTEAPEEKESSEG